MNSNPNPPSRFARLLAVLAILTGLAISTARAGTHYWSGDGADNLWSNPANWSIGGQPFPNEANCFLIFPAASGYVSINDVTNLLIARMTIQHDSYIFAASGGAKFTFRGGVSLSSSYASTFNNSAAIELQGTNEWQIASPGYVSLNGVVSGTGDLVKVGTGTLALGGSAPNTATGSFEVLRGELRLAKPAGVNAIAGPLVIGSNVTDNASSARVVTYAAQQIADTAPVSVRHPGELNLNGFNETIGPLEMLGGGVNSAGGLLTLAGDVLCDGPHIPGFNVACGLFGSVSLGNQTRTFTTTPYGSLILWANLSGGAGAGFTKMGSGGMLLFGTNSYSGTTLVREGTLGAGGVLHTVQTPFGTTGAGTTVASGAKLSIAAIDIGAEPLQLNGAAFEAIGDCSWAGPVLLNSTGTNTVLVQDTINATGGHMNFSGVISGAGSLRFVGDPITGSDTDLTFSGPAANTFSGATLVDSGTLRLGKSPNTTAIPGPLLIGTNGYSNVANTKVLSLAANQIADNVPVSIRSPGSLHLNGFNEAVGPLELLGGSVITAGGLLTLTADVACDGPVYDVPAASQLDGLVSLGNQSRVFSVTTNGALWIGAAVSGGANVGFTKAGRGRMAMWGLNTYSGTTIVAEGVLGAGHAFFANETPLGSTAGGTVVKPGGYLQLNSVDLGNESITLEDGVAPFGAQLSTEGPCALSGVITVTATNDAAIYNYGGTLTLSGTITGPGPVRFIVADEPGTSTTLTGPNANTYQGRTLLLGGPLLLNKPDGVVAIPGDFQINQGNGNSSQVQLLHAEQIANTAAVFLDASGSLNCNNLPETIGSLAGNGLVNTLFSTLTVGGNNLDTTFAGTLGGSGATTLIKQGTGTLTFTGAQSYLGRTRVTGGKLLVNGSVLSPIAVTGGATLGGHGVVNTVSSTNGIISPGTSPGRLFTKDIVLNNSTLRIELNGTSPGVNQDQLRTTGAVMLANCTLDATATFVSAIGQQYTIIDNDGADAVSGTFAGLPQGAIVNISGANYTISYAGGDGNDVVLTHVNTAPNFTSLAATPYANEGGTISVDGVINDPDASDNHTLVINWGDGTAPQTNYYASGVFNVHVEHTYADDKPGANASDSFTITYTLTDTAGSPALGNLPTVIGNVAPSFPNFGSIGLKSGEALATTLTFTDPGSDTWTATVDYGDGTGTQPLAVGANKSLALNHTFPTNGLYTVTLNVNDDDTGTTGTTFKVYVGLELTITKRNLTHSFVRWPGVFTGFALERTTELGVSASWTPVPEAVSLVGGQWQALVPHTNGNAFFRLVKP